MSAATAKKETGDPAPESDPGKARPFVFVRHGESWPVAAGPALSCDGLVPGEAPGDHVLHLSHWNGNATPEEFYQDTSTGIALAFAAAVQAGTSEVARQWGRRLAPPSGADPANKVVGEVASDVAQVAAAVNNHFDTDGLLAAYVVQHPEQALPHHQLLVDAAEAGDFDEWPADDLGLKLQFAIEGRVGALLEEHGPFPDTATQDAWLYRRLLPQVHALVTDVAAGGGEALWGEAYEACQEYYGDLQTKEVYSALLEAGVEGQLLEVTDLTAQWTGAPRLGLVVHPLGFDGAVFPHALHRRFFGRGNAEHGDGAGVERYLIAHAVSGAEATDPPRYMYRYMRPGHAWAPTVTRPRVLLPPNVDELADVLGETTGTPWERDTDSLTGLVQCMQPTDLPPEDVCLAVLDADAGMQCSFDLWR